MTDRDARIAELYRSGMKIKDIAAEVAMAPNSVGVIIKRLGFERPSKPQKAWREYDDAAIIAMWDAGCATGTIADRYQTNLQTIRRILKQHGIDIATARRTRFESEAGAVYKGGGLGRIARRA